MAWLEGAIRKPILRHDTPMLRYDAVVNHIAVSDGASLYGYFSQDGNPTSHFYVRKAGPQGTGAGMADYEQYVDTQFRAPAQLQGNARCISIETQGGVGADLNEGWTVAQVNRLAWIAAECHRLHGIPLVRMPDSLPTSRGVGYHRLGIDPWRVDGGELWSRSAYKVCPGDSRITQIPDIIARARAQEEPVTPEDIEAIAQRTAVVLLTKSVTTPDNQTKSVQGALGEGSYANDAFAAFQNFKPQLDRIEALAATPFDITKLAEAIVAKLPPWQPIDQATLEAALRSVLGSVDGD